MIKTKYVEGYPFITYSKDSYSDIEMKKRSSDFYNHMDQRRTVRDFSDKPVPRKVIEELF